MPFWKLKSNLAGRVFAILRLRPTIGEEQEPTNGLAGHNHADLPPRPLPPSMIGLMSAHADLTTTHLVTSVNLSDSISSSEDCVLQARNNQKYVTACSHLMIIIHEGQCIALVPRQGCYYNWREIVCCWGQFHSRNRQVRNCLAS
jgi:hypothetical protein